MPQEDDEAAELDHGEEILFVGFPAHDQPAEVVQPSEKALDLPPAAVAAQGAAVLGFASPVRSVRRHQFDAVISTQLLIERVAVVGRVADHLFWLGADETLCECGFDELRFMRRSAGEAAGDRKTMAVCDRHDFAAFAAASWADSSAPFLAGVKLASMNVSDKSSLPRSRKSSASRRKMPVSVPSRYHC